MRPSVLVQSIRSQNGFSLLEISVSLLVLSIAVTGFVGAAGLAQKATGAAETESGATADLTSQMEAIGAHPLQSTYDVVVTVPPNATIGVEVEDLRPQLPNSLQLVRVKSLSASTNQVVQQLETYKANRFLETGIAPSASGLEHVAAIQVPILARQLGYFQVVQQIPSAANGDLSLRWRVSQNSLSDHAILVIYKGKPFGEGPTGTSIAHPVDVTAAVAAMGKIDGESLTLGVSARGTDPGIYTLYLFNNHHGNKDLTTESAEISCLCLLEAAP